MTAGRASVRWHQLLLRVAAGYQKTVQYLLKEVLKCHKQRSGRCTAHVPTLSEHVVPVLMTAARNGEDPVH